MEEYREIIDILQKQKRVAPPAGLTDLVMEKLKKHDKKATVLFNHDALHIQCAFLLFVVGSFYLVAGITAVWQLYDALTAGHLSFWLKMQPFIPLGSGLLMLPAAFLLFYRPMTAAWIQYALILHLCFVFVNGLILEKMLSVPLTWLYVLILTMLAVVLGVLLLGAIRSMLKVQLVCEEGTYAKTI